ncbi:MAG: hypothetical protein H0V70_10040 [Ktedonobacteraceae bacterium]|nr:hypothetical protein [Ktedonobacteraceae bacterium]
MVEINQNAFTPQSTPLHYEVEEQSLVPKTTNDEECEDALYIGPSFVAVIDGATSKTERRWDGQTGGRIAALTLKEAFDHIPPDATAREAIDILTTAIKELYEHYQVLDIMRDDPVQRATACVVVVSFFRKEVWFVGDCQCLLNQKLLLNKKKIDTITANARSMFLETEIAKGKAVEELRQNDTGRAFILPLLERQMLFQNNPAAGQYWFSIIDGFAVSDEGIYVQSLPTDIQTIVLASDGYPYLKETLEASEACLQEVLDDDPLLFQKHKATKGVSKGNISFDDRAYIKLNILPLPASSASHQSTAIVEPGKSTSISQGVEITASGCLSSVRDYDTMAPQLDIDELDWHKIVTTPHVQHGLRNRAAEARRQAIAGEFEEGGFVIE